MAKRIASFLYGVVSYGAGVAALVALILIKLGVLDFTGGPLQIEHIAGAAVFNLLLMLGFGLQHSIMARKKFKDRWMKIIPQSVERSPFVLATGLVLGPALWLWQPMDATIWSVSNPIFAAVLTGIGALGWGYLFVSSFAIDHFELLGLEQVWCALGGTELTRETFDGRFSRLRSTWPAPRGSTTCRVSKRPKRASRRG